MTTLKTWYISTYASRREWIKLKVCFFGGSIGKTCVLILSFKAIPENCISLESWKTQLSNDILNEGINVFCGPLRSKIEMTNVIANHFSRCGSRVRIFNFVRFSRWWQLSIPVLKILARDKQNVLTLHREEISRRFQKCPYFCPYDHFWMIYNHFQNDCSVMIFLSYCSSTCTRTVRIEGLGQPNMWNVEVAIYTTVQLATDTNTCLWVLRGQPNMWKLITLLVQS